MGLIQTAAETYETLQQKYAGEVAEGKTTLAPVAHILTSAQIEISLDQEGNFVSAALLDKSEPKIVIPVTEESAGRTSSPCAHPLCDQLVYIAGYNQTKHTLYEEQLKEWTESPYSHPALKPILKYVQGKTILQDLGERGLIKISSDGVPENEKMLVRWRVIFPDKTVESWRDKKLFEAFIHYYENKKTSESTDICMISGENLPVATQHPKGIISISGNAKLISANDTSGFTYRGRFENDTQALTISYEMSQKAHNALRWLAADQGIRVVFGGRTFLCWNPHGIEVCNPTGGFILPGADPVECRKVSDYSEQLRRTLSGLRLRLPDTEKVVIAAFDAATTGRLALTYYNELLGSDYLQRLKDWDMKCCWYGRRGIIQSPRLSQIVNHAFGVQRVEKGRAQMKTDDRVLRQQIQRLVVCRVDTGRIPRDIVQALVNHASFPQALDENLWRDVVFTTCAVLNKRYLDEKNTMKEENTGMGWTLDNPDRSFQFGRLLAAMEKVEQDYYYQSGGGKDDSRPRMTTAIKSLSRFRQRPMTTYSRIQEHLWQAYIPRLNSASRMRYEKLRGEIMDIVARNSAAEIDEPLKDIYLLGYDLQRNEFFKSVKKDITAEETE